MCTGINIWNLYQTVQVVILRSHVVHEVLCWISVRKHFLFVAFLADVFVTYGYFAIVLHLYKGNTDFLCTDGKKVQITHI